MKVDLEKLKSQGGNELELNEKLKRETNGLQLKVDYPVEVETHGQSKLKIATKYHLLKIHRLAYLSEEQFGCTYRLVYNRFNKPQWLRPLEDGEESQKFEIQMKSFVGDPKNSAFYCNNCLGEDYEAVASRRGECFNSCSTDKIIFECASETCGSRFCILCKYRIKGDEMDNYCNRGHRVIKGKDRLESYIENQKEIKFDVCDFCGHGERHIHVD